MIGEQVGLTLRMESVAPPGGVTLSESTAYLVNNTAVLANPELVLIKGHDEPVSARRLLAVEPGHGAVAGAESSLVGRRWEMAALDAKINQAIGGRGGVEGCRADSGRRRQRVVKALNQARTQGHEISVSAIARMASVDRSFLFRHKDLLAEIHTAEATPLAGEDRVGVMLGSLKADLANPQQRITRLADHNQKLERKLSELLGEQAWRESGLGAPTEIDQLQHSTTKACVTTPPQSRSAVPRWMPIT